MNPTSKIKSWYEDKLFWFRVKRGLSKRAKKKFRKYSLSHKVIFMLKRFWLEHWKFILTYLIAISGVIVLILQCKMK